MAHRGTHVLSRLKIVNYVDLPQGKLTCQIFFDKTRFEAQVFDTDVKVGVNLVQVNNLTPGHNQSYLKGVQSELKPNTSEESRSCFRTLQLHALIFYELNDFFVLGLKLTFFKLALIWVILFSLARSSCQPCLPCKEKRFLRIDAESLLLYFKELGAHFALTSPSQANVP